MIRSTLRNLSEDQLMIFLMQFVAADAVFIAFFIEMIIPLLSMSSVRALFIHIQDATIDVFSLVSFLLLAQSTNALFQTSPSVSVSLSGSRLVNAVAYLFRQAISRNRDFLIARETAIARNTLC